MSVYTYFILGIILGLSIAVVIWADKSEKFENKIEFERKMFCTQKLDNMIEAATNKIASKIRDKKEDLSEAEKDEIIAQCCKDVFEI